MRKVLLLLLVFFSFTVRAQYVTISDTAFVIWLNGFDSCMVGNQMDTTCPAILSVHEITFNPFTAYAIRDLDGIQYFDSLQVLHWDGGYLNHIPALPPLLDTFSCMNNRLTSLPTLPVGLKSLFCSLNTLDSLPQLPNSLRALVCEGCQLISIPNLPDSLNALLCKNNLITTLPAFPDSLFTCSIMNNPIQCLPQLKRIVNFSFISTSIGCLPNYGEITNSNPSVHSLPLCDSLNSNGCSYCHAFFTIYPDSFNPGVYYGLNQSYGSNLTSYLWEFGDGGTSTSQYPSHTYAQAGQYYVCLSVSGPDCTNTYCDSSYLVFKTENGLMNQLNILAPTGVEEISNSNSSFRLSPNPASSSVTISMDESMVGGNVAVGDITGRRILITNIEHRITNIETESFANGVYFITVVSKEGRSATKKLVVSK